MLPLRSLISCQVSPTLFLLIECHRTTCNTQFTYTPVGATPVTGTVCLGFV